MSEPNPTAIAFIVFLILQRLVELLIGSRNTKRALARGAVEVGAVHYPWLIAMHSAWVAAIAVAGYDKAISWPMLGIFAFLQCLRIWIMASLGERWTTRIIVDGAPLVRTGPYKWFRHPNYMLVVAEIFVSPMVLGLLSIALAFSALNAFVLYIRISAEERALGPKRSPAP